MIAKILRIVGAQWEESRGRNDSGIRGELTPRRGVLKLEMERIWSERNYDDWGNNEGTSWCSAHF